MKGRAFVQLSPPLGSLYLERLFLSVWKNSLSAPLYIHPQRIKEAGCSRAEQRELQRICLCKHYGQEREEEDKQICGTKIRERAAGTERGVVRILHSRAAPPFSCYIEREPKDGLFLWGVPYDR